MIKEIVKDEEKYNIEFTNKLLKSIHWKVRNKYTERDCYFFLLETEANIVPFEVEVDRVTYYSYEIGYPYIRSFFTLPHRWHVFINWFDDESVDVLKTKYGNKVFSPTAWLDERSEKVYFKLQVNKYLDYLTK